MFDTLFPFLYPGRTAALAATAAITALSSVQGDGKHDPTDAPFNALPKSKRTKFRTLAISTSEGAITIEKPASIDRLPYELRVQIISYVEDDAYTLLNLLLVSKIWYLTLMQSEQAEKNWMRLCKIMGAKRKSKGRLSWHSTLVYLLHKHCIGCFAKARCPVGLLFVRGFKFLVICDECRITPGPWQLQSFRILAEKYSLNFEDMLEVPRCFTLNRDYFERWTWEEDHCQGELDMGSTLDGPVRQLQAWSKMRHSSLVDGCPPTIDKGALLQALEHSRERLDPPSSLLNRAIVQLKLAETPDEHLYGSVVDIFKKIGRILEVEGGYPKIQTVKRRTRQLHPAEL